MEKGRFLTDKNETLVVRFLVIVVAYFLLRSIVKRNIKEAESIAAKKALATGDDNALYAVQVRQCINQSGFVWLMKLDGTKLEELYNVARKILNIDKVSDIYRGLYGSELLIDVQSDLEPDEFARFMSLLGKGGATGKIYAKFNNVPVFSASGSGEDWNVDFNDTVTTFDAGDYLTDEVIANAVYSYQNGTTVKFYIFTVSSYFLFSKTVAVDIRNIVEK